MFRNMKRALSVAALFCVGLSGTQLLANTVVYKAEISGLSSAQAGFLSRAGRARHCWRSTRAKKA